MESFIIQFYHTSDVLNTLSEIKASDLVKYSNDISFINEMITSISRSREIQLSRGKLKYLKDIIFKYDPTIMEMFTSIDVARDDINWAQGQIRRFEATGVYRYRGVDAYKGVAGERVISRYLMNIFPSIVLNTPIGEGNAIDEFDFRLNELTCDIKCSTQLHYASITPKVAVENGTPKDYYIGARFDDRDPEHNRVYIIGYLTHREIARYRILQKYGAPYYEVSLLDMHNFDNLLNILRDNNEQR